MINRRFRLLAAVLISTGVCAARASGQARPALPAPAAPAVPSGGISKATYDNPAGGRAEIGDFVRKNVEALLNDQDPAAQAKAREDLVKWTSIGGQPAQPLFMFEYAKALNDALLPRLDPKKASLRQRINAAIVTAKVAAVAQNIGLEPVTLKLLEDPSEPVVLWAIKAARPIVPERMKLRAPGDKRVPGLVKAIAPAVFRHPSGAIFEEAYAALGDPGTAGTLDVAQVDELISLWGNRLEQYRKEVPEDPAVDGRPISYLTNKQLWTTVFNNNKNRQIEIMQMICNQISMAGQYADAGATGDRRDQLLKLIQRCGEGCWVVGNGGALADASAPLIRLNPIAIGPNTKMMPLVSAVVDEIRKAFPGVNAPPVIGTPAAAGAGVAKP